MHDDPANQPGQAESVSSGECATAATIAWLFSRSHWKYPLSSSAVGSHGDAKERTQSCQRSCAAGYEVPKTYEVVERIGRTEAGRLNRTRLAEAQGAGSDG